VSFDVEFVPGPRAIRGEDREIESRLADAWDDAERAVGGIDALEEAGMTVTWSAERLSVSIPYGVDAEVAERVEALFEHLERELGRLGWIVDEATSSRA
jgi:hypothetical protein